MDNKIIQGKYMKKAIKNLKKLHSKPIKSVMTDWTMCERCGSILPSSVICNCSTLPRGYSICKKRKV